MSKIVRYVFVGNRTVIAAQMLAIALGIIVYPWILIAIVPNLVVYLLLTIVKIEEELERPIEFIEGFKEGRFRK